MELVSWNVNGIRAATEKGFLAWFAQGGADVICLQEVKANTEQLNEDVLHPLGYHSFWHSAEKRGYSGVAVYAKREPQDVKVGIGDPLIDREGRVLTLDFGTFMLINAYFPNSQRDHGRLGFKLNFCEQMATYLKNLVKRGKNVVICGDFNIAHKEIDLRNPKTNVKNAGFLPEERAWLDRFVKDGFVDAFRRFQTDPLHYTWWSYRPTVRERNIGWRLDYFFANEGFADRLAGMVHHPEVTGSDHCPVRLRLKN